MKEAHTLTIIKSKQRQLSVQLNRTAQIFQLFLREAFKI
jgi:hypothetical protein